MDVILNIRGFFILLIRAGWTVQSVFIIFLKVNIIAIVCVATFINCQTLPTRGYQRNAGRTSGGLLDQGLSVM